MDDPPVPDKMPAKNCPVNILILEDEEAHAELIERSFEDVPGSSCLKVAQNLREARMYLDHETPDLIIADWLLPDGKGIDILPRKDGVAEVPLVIMTSHGDEKLAVEMMKSGAIDYVVKSESSLRELPHISRRVLREWKNISERKKAEEALKNSEMKYRTLIENSGTGIILLDREGTYLLVNKLAAGYLGSAAADIVGKSMFDFLPKDTAQYYLDRNRALIDTCSREEYEDTFELETGKKSFIIIDQCVKDSAGRGIALQSSSVDITGRKTAENALRENEVRLAKAAELARIVDWEFDLKTGMFTFNDDFYALYGTTAEREGGYLMPADVYARRFVHPDDVPRVAEEITKITATEDPRFSGQIEHRIIRRDGGLRYIIAHYTVVMDASGRHIKNRGVNQDITDRVSKEKALALANQKLQLMNIVAWHDIQNKLTGLRGYVELSKDMIEDKTVKEFLSTEEDILRTIDTQIQYTKAYQEIGRQQP